MSYRDMNYGYLGEEPEDTTGIWAYDDRRMIVSVNNDAAPSTFKIVDR